jgi:hypothetical protein
MIEVETPDGGIAEFPDGTSPEVIKNALRKRFPPPQTVADGKGDRERTWGETAQDVALSGLQGINSGVQSLAGTIGDAQQMTGDVAAWGAGKLGLSPETQGMVKEVAGRIPAFGMKFPTTEQVGAVVNPITGQYSPQTTAGRWTESVGEMVPAAIAGPGSVARKTAMAVIPGVSMAAVGDMTDQNAYAKAGAGILTGVLTAGRGGKAGTKELLKEAPTRESVKDTKDAAYKALDDAKIVYDQNAYKGAAMKIKYGLADKGWDKLQGGEIGPLVNRVDALLKPRAVANWTKVDGILKDAKAIARSGADETTKMQANIFVRQLEDLVKSDKFKSKTGMAQSAVNETVAEARDYARRNILSREIDTMRRRLPGYVSGDESGWRNQFGSYLKSPESASLSPGEREAFSKVVRREGPMNVAHNMGSRWGQIAGGSTGGVVGGLLGSMFGPVGTAAGAAIGAGVSMGTQNLFRKFMEVYTEKGVDNAMKTVLAGRTEQEKAAVLDLVDKTQARARALLGADASVHSAAPQWFIQDANGKTYPAPSASLLGVPR